MIGRNKSEGRRQKSGSDVEGRREGAELISGMVKLLSNC